MAQIIDGDLLDFKDAWLVHQCNCISVNGKGLSKDISDRYPYADPYCHRTPVSGKSYCIEDHRDKPGTYKIFSDKNDGSNPKIISLFAQYDIGKPGRYYGPRPKDFDDDRTNRLKWFQKALFDFGQYIKDNYTDKQDIYIPFMCGCGLGGGDWSNYLSVIQLFSSKFKENINCFIVKYNKN